MNLPPASSLSETAVPVMVICILLASLVPAALALIAAGLGRSRSAAHSMVASLCVIAVAAIVFFFCGFGLAGYPGGHSHVLSFAGRDWDWIAAGPFLIRGLDPITSPPLLSAWLQMLAVAITAIIPLGSGADRWRLGPACVSTGFLAAFTYPLFAHWAWGGWLAQVGRNFGLGRGLLDTGGSGVIHVVGGVTALAVCWILGPRRGKYSADGMPAAIPGHNSVFVLFGCLIALPGWIALNSAAALLLAGATPAQIAPIAINTTLSAAAAGLAAALVTGVRFGKPDASLISNGWIGGLVAGSAGCLALTPAWALVIGLIAGALVTRSAELLEVHLGIDDPAGSISVHAIAGLWGLLAAGIFVRSHPGQFLAQVVGVATLLGFVLPLSYALNWLLDRIYRQRVALEGERLGMDLHELGAGAYPDFVTHSDEFIQR